MIAMVAFIGGACQPTREVDLLTVDKVEPTAIEPGHRVTVHGSGFPTGRAAVVVLQGTLHRPGGDAAETEFETEAHAVSSNELVFGATPKLFSAVGGRATFRGQIKARFDALGKWGSVCGRRSPITLDFLPSVSPPRRSHLARQHDSEALLDELGLGLASEPMVRAGPRAWGLRLVRVRAGSPAARAGLQAGDRLVGSRGLRLQNESDLRRPAQGGVLALQIQRPGESRSAQVSLVLGASGRSPSPGRGWAPVVWSVLLGFLLCFFAPTARLGARWVSDPRPPRRRRPGSEAGRGQPWIGRVWAALAVACLGGTFEVIPGDYDVWLLLVLAIGTRMGAAAEGGAASVGRFSRVGGALFESLPLIVGVAYVVTLGSDWGLRAIVSAQKGGFWNWYALRNPLALAAVLSIVPGLFRATGAARRAPRAIWMHIHVLLTVAMVVLLFFGGWAPVYLAAPSEAGGAPFWWGALGYGAKAAILLSIAHHWSGRTPSEIARPVVPIAGSLLVAAATVAAFWSPSLLGVLDDLGQPLLFAMLGFGSLHAVLRRWRLRRPRMGTAKRKTLGPVSARL